MPKVLVVGDVIDDILVTPGSAIRLDTDTNATIASKPGGSGANFACWLASLGVETHFVGRVGHADLAKQTAILEHFGVIPHLQSDLEQETGKIVILIDGQNRSFLTDRGANVNLDLASIPQELFGDALYISGYSVFDQSVEQMQRLIRRGKQTGIVMCDPGSSGYIADHSVPEFLNSIAGADVLVPSLSEGKILTAEDRPDLIAHQLTNRFSLVALTLGPDGAQLAWSDRNERVEGFSAEVIDPTGAGDAFAAKFLAELLALKEPEVAATEANRFAAKAVTVSGGRPKN